MRISSPSDPLIKSIRRAARRSGLTDDGLALAESPHLLEEAVQSGLTVEATLLAESAIAAVGEAAQRLHPGFHTIPDKLFAELSSTENSQGLLSLVRLPTHEWDSVLRNSELVVILDGVQDPGNAGAIVRSVEAFGVDGIVFGRGTASPTNPKTLRASAGSLFRIPFVKAGPVDRVLDSLQSVNLPLYAATAHDGDPLGQVDLSRAAIVIGSEAHGVSPEYLQAARAIHVPVRGVESLNAAAAAAIILYAAAEQQKKRQ